MPNACIKFYVTIDIPDFGIVSTDEQKEIESELRLELIHSMIDSLAHQTNGTVTDLEIKEF